MVRNEPQYLLNEFLRHNTIRQVFLNQHYHNQSSQWKLAKAPQAPEDGAVSCLTSAFPDHPESVSDRHTGRPLGKPYGHLIHFPAVRQVRRQNQKGRDPVY